MKNIYISFFICCMFLFSGGGVANATSYLENSANETVDTAKKFEHWKFTGVAGLNITQTQFWNWAGGGNNNAHGRIFANLRLIYKKDKSSWETNLDTEFGMMYAPETRFQWRKPNDRINFMTKYGYEFSKTWYVTIMGEFKSQYARGYDYKTENGIEEEHYVSNWLSPSYTDLSIGIDWKPNTIFSLYLSPVAGRITSCTDSLLRSKYGVPEDKKVAANLGMLFRASANYEIIKNLKLISALTLYSPYTSKDQPFGNIDVDWDFVISYQFLKVMNVSLGISLKYYDQVLIANSKGEKAARVQFREVLGIGLGYTF